MKDDLKDVGIWGQRHYQYLTETKPSVIDVMRMNGNLIHYLQSVDDQADEMSFQLVKQVADYLNFDLSQLKTNQD